MSNEIRQRSSKENDDIYAQISLLLWYGKFNIETSESKKVIIYL